MKNENFEWRHVKHVLSLTLSFIQCLFREENEKVLKVYQDKWVQYEQVYESDPLAQEIRAMKLQTCSLEEEGIASSDMIVV